MPGKRLPEELSAPFRDYLDYAEHLDRLLHLSMHGISMVRGLPKAIEVLSKIEAEEERAGEKDPQRQLARAKAEAELAQKEVDNGFPLLHEQAVISLWGALEAVIRNVAVAWLKRTPASLRVEPLAQIRVRVGDYESLDVEDRYHYLCDLLEQEVRAPLKQGIGRFEIILEAFNLGGGTTDEIRKDLFELSQVRNVYAHRRGIIDRRFVAACPWLQMELGKRLTTSHEQYVRYYKAGGQYVWELITRIARAIGWDPVDLNRPDHVDPTAANR